MNYYWFCKAGRDDLRSNGANHIIPVEWNGWNSIKRIDDKTGKQWIFEADESFELMCKFRYNATPVEISSRHYNRIVSGKGMTPTDQLRQQMSNLLYGRIENPCSEIFLPAR